MSPSVRDTEETDGCVTSVTYIQANQANKEQRLDSKQATANVLCILSFNPTGNNQQQTQSQSIMTSQVNAKPNDQ